MGNYRVQDVASRRVFVSRDVVFEEGYPHRTSPKLPLFDTLGKEVLVDDSERKELGRAVGRLEDANNSRNVNVNEPLGSNSVSDGNNHPDNTGPDTVGPDNAGHEDIPVIPVTPTIQPRRSARTTHPSTAKLQSQEYQTREKTSRDDGEDWATSRRPHASFVSDRTTAEVDDYIACMMETKASHHIPRSYHHAITTD